MLSIAQDLDQVMCSNLLRATGWTLAAVFGFGLGAIAFVAAILLIPGLRSMLGIGV
jgi:hypothetical protein